MPKLLTFGVCRQAITNRDDGSVSLISLISSLTIQKRAEEVIPHDANTFYEWGAVAAWLRLDEDTENTFEQRLRIVSPDGTTIDLGITPIIMESRLVSAVLRAQGFPIGQPGLVTLQLELRKSGTEEEWMAVAEYPIEIIHQVQEEDLGVPT